MLVFVLCLLVERTSLAKDYASPVETPKGNLDHLFFLPKSSLLLGSCPCGTEPTIRFWSSRDGKLKGIIQLGYREWVTSMLPSYSENLIAIASFKLNTIGCYSVSEDRWLWKAKWIENDPFTVKRVLFTPDDQKIMAFGEKVIVTYDARKGDILHTQAEPLNEYMSFRYASKGYVISPSGRHFMVWQDFPLKGHATWGSLFFKNKKVTIWDFERMRPVTRWTKESMICDGAFATDEREIVVGQCDGHILIKPISEDRVIKRWKAHENARYPDAEFQLMSVLLSADNRHLATYGDDEDGRDGVKVWDYLDGELLHSFHKVSGRSWTPGKKYPMAFSPDGKYFAFEQHGNLCIYDTQTWEQKWCVPSWPEGQK
jgi:WD40 repeat protein